MLGVPREDWNFLAGWAAALRADGRGTPREITAHQAVDALHAYVDVMIAQRCAHPTDDLLGELVNAEIDGAGFTTDELHLSVSTLLTMACPLACPSERSTPQT
jgi:cytochrome P450